SLGIRFEAGNNVVEVCRGAKRRAGGCGAGVVARADGRTNEASPAGWAASMPLLLRLSRPPFLPDRGAAVQSSWRSAKSEREYVVGHVSNVPAEEARWKRAPQRSPGGSGRCAVSRKRLPPRCDSPESL